MIQRWIMILLFIMPGTVAYCQVADTISRPVTKTPAIDTTFDYDDLFQDFDAFMDSILSPHSYFLAGLSVSKGYYTFESKASAAIESRKRINYSPTLAYYHSSGFGFTATGYAVKDQVNLNLYQVGITPSFDYLKDKRLATGISFTKYITKDSLPFYNTPIQNELYGYFTWRKSWIRPTVSFSYGWGSHTELLKRETIINDIRLQRRGYVFINSKESVGDFSMLASVRHDFYWLDVFARNDHIRVTPVISFTAGTQKFGFNQSSNTYATLVRSGANVLYSTSDFSFDDQLKFQPLSAAFSLRGEYFIGPFFVQPQYTLDYYFPASDKKLTGLFSVNAGFIF